MHNFGAFIMRCLISRPFSNLGSPAAHTQVSTATTAVTKKSPMEMIADVAPVEVEGMIAMCDGGTRWRRRNDVTNE
jgi:hypothetical protein